MERSQPKPEQPEHLKKTPPGPSNAIHIVWQLATYVLWAFTLFALSVFVIALLDYFFNDGSSSEFEYAVYFFAVLLCLTPLAFFADKMYRKYEPAEKHGFAAVVMVLSAILVFIAVLSGLITAVVSLVSLLISTSASEMGITIASSLIITALGGMFLLRILNQPRFAALTKWFPWAVIAVASVATIFAIAGPFRGLITSKQDRLIEQNINVLDNEIQNYAIENGELPKSLSDLKFDDPYYADAKALVTRNLVTYKPINDDRDIHLYSGDLSYRLCATFKYAKGNGVTEESKLYTVDSNHGKGEQCYRSEVTTYNQDDPYYYDKPAPLMMREAI